ncbi:MAG TPA: secondary thiamine-phosphate synthase enzyme YjbQ [Pseudolabrys sp.]|jgi:secondary thiamine-phosphate synthase enzyme|nr:secondary thiamine-phosphate synthase enzyme YjbQ [Pseudolabrys sp.]
MPGRLSAISAAVPQLIASASLRLDTPGAGFTEITAQAADFIAQCGGGDGTLLVYLRHTSASLAIQENADPDVQADLAAALDRLAPQDAPWIHDVEGPDDMPAHVKALLTGVSLHVPVAGGKLALGAWQGLYLIEHRRRAHSREVIFQFIGSRK